MCKDGARKARAQTKLKLATEHCAGVARKANRAWSTGALPAEIKKSFSACLVIPEILCSVLVLITKKKIHGLAGECPGKGHKDV